MMILKDHVTLLSGKGRDPLEYPQNCSLEWLPPLYDVVSTDGTTLKERSISRQQFNSALDWPMQVRPPEKDWKVWRSFLWILLNESSGAMEQYQFGAWRYSHIQWRWVGNPNASLIIYWPNLQIHHRKSP